MELKASLTSPGSRPMSGYCPTSARWTASILISSMVRSARCWEKAIGLIVTVTGTATRISRPLTSGTWLILGRLSLGTSSPFVLHTLEMFEHWNGCYVADFKMLDEQQLTTSVFENGGPDRARPPLRAKRSSPKK